MKTETKLKIIINILCLLLGMTSTALYLSIKQTKNREATIKIVNEARVSWRNEAYRLGYRDVVTKYVYLDSVVGDTTIMAESNTTYIGPLE